MGKASSMSTVAGAFASLAIVSGLSTQAVAQNTVSYISSTGSDAAACDRANPCRNTVVA